MRGKHTSQNMGLFDKQISFIDSLEKQIFNVLRDSININGIEIKDYIIEKQLYEKGIDGNEKRLKGYTRQTIRYKISKGQPADRTTLKDEGIFHASITIDAYADKFIVSSDVGYAKYLVKRYGDKIMKPSVRNMTEFFNKHFIPDLKTYINGQFTR